MAAATLKTNKKITSFALYRSRYVLAYIVLGIILAELLILALLYIPSGLNQMERTFAVSSSQLLSKIMEPESVIYAPYQLLQYLSLKVFGVTTLSVKFASFVMAIGSIVGMILLLRVWFARNIAIITTLLIITTSQFLYIAQSGTPAISYAFFPIWILLAALMISRKAKFQLGWKMVLFGLAALSLYIPLSIYVLLALVIATSFHPHLRYIFRKLSKQKLAIASLLSLLLIAPLIRAIVLDRTIGLRLLGIPKEWPNFYENLMMLLNQYFNFLYPSSSVLVTPIYGITSMLIIAIGIIGLLTANYSARSYIILTWSVLLLPLLILNPKFTTVTFVPMMLLLAFGVKRLFSMWYRLFPKNPYARTAGLIPLSVLIISMVVSGANRYGFGYHYDPNTAQYFDQDVRLINNQILNKSPKVKERFHLIVIQSELEFYNTMASYRTDLRVSTLPELSQTGTTIITRQARQAGNYGSSIDRVVVDARKNNGDRFYLYNSRSK